MTAEAILTAAEMRVAEDEVIASGVPASTLMERAGAAVADAVFERAGNARDVLVLCGPGNNGGDGYIAARLLAAGGWRVRVAASAPPATEDVRAARALWTGPVEEPGTAAPAPVLIDALFGTGLTRRLEPALAAALVRLGEATEMSVAVDLPSGVASDNGRILSPVPRFTLGLALGALQPAHLLQPAARTMETVEVADIGVPASSFLTRIAVPRLIAPGPDDHKYTRGLVAVIGGAMPGAAALAVLGAAHSGAGYVRLHAPETVAGLPHSVVQRRYAAAALDRELADSRIGAVVVGSGLGNDLGGRAVLDVALGCGRPLVLDADALAMLDGRPLAVPAILTPHEGEFARTFPVDAASKVERAREAARRVRAVVLLKGADTVVAAPDGRAAISAPLPPTLGTAGTGDILAGICGTMLAQLGDPFAAACAAVWLHGEAARRIGGPLVADDLASRLPAAVQACW